jgi:integrase
MEGMLKPWNGAKPRERDWFKDEAADKTIKALWGLTDGIDRNEGRYLKLLILTGKRKTALAEMRWEHVKDVWFWNAPKSDVKNKRLHGVPLSNLAQRVLHPRQKRGLALALSRWSFHFDIM